MWDSVDLYTFLRSLFAVYCAPFPCFDARTLGLMRDIIVIESSEEGTLFLRTTFAPSVTVGTSSSLFYSLSKIVWETLKSDPQIDPILTSYLTWQTTVYHRTEGNRFLLVFAPHDEPTTQSLPRGQPILRRKRGEFQICKVECLYRTNWNKKYPLGVSNPIHANFSNPDEFSKIVLDKYPNQRIIDDLWTLKQNCSAIDVDRILGHYCPLPHLEGVRSMSPTQVLRSVQMVPFLMSSPESVACVVSKLVQSILPTRIWCQGARWRNAIREYISLGRFESMDFGSMRWGNTRLIFFVFKRVVVPLISYLFYCTDCDISDGPSIVYIRRPVWDLVVGKASHGLSEILKLEPCTGSPLAASVRWLPKKAGMRPVVRQPKFIKDKTKKLLRYFSALRHAYSEKLGYSVFTREACKEPFARFAEHVGGPIHFFTADIQNCFESIPFGPLEVALTELAPPNTLFSSVMVTCGSGSAPKRKRPIVFVRNDLGNLISQLPASSDASRPIFVQASLSSLSDERLNYHCVKTEVMRIVRSSVYNLNTEGTTTTRTSFKVTQTGLPQGSSFSVMLVSLFYGWIDRDLVSPFLTSTVLVRLVDDLVCLSRSESELRSLLSLVVEKRIYGSVNESKLRIGSAASKDSIDWAGFQLQPDITGKLNLRTVQGTDSVLHASGRRVSDDLLEYFNASLGRSIAQTCLPVLFDARINTIRCLRQNAFTSGRIAGHKLRHRIEAFAPCDASIAEFVEKLRRYAKRRFKDTTLVRIFQSGIIHALGNG